MSEIHQTIRPIQSRRYQLDCDYNLESERQNVDFVAELWLDQVGVILVDENHGIHFAGQVMVVVLTLMVVVVIDRLVVCYGALPFGAMAYVDARDLLDKFY